jgi:hypothetical protein
MDPQLIPLNLTKKGPNRMLYAVYWVGYSAKEPTWETKELILADAPIVLHTYKAKIATGT